MEHLIKEIFLVVPNLGLRVADGQYDLCGPQDEILSPSNWGSMIEPGWEITMRMWPSPERPPWEYAGPRAMLQDRQNIRSRRQDEASHRSVSQQEEDDVYDSENPRVRDPVTSTTLKLKIWNPFSSKKKEKERRGRNRSRPRPPAIRPDPSISPPPLVSPHPPRGPTPITIHHSSEEDEDESSSPPEAKSEHRRRT